MRSKGEHIGTVEAPDRERAEAVAIKQFDLNQDQRSRLRNPGSGSLRMPAAKLGEKRAR